VIADFNADAQQNKPIASEYGVSSYPTVKFFPKGDNKTPIAYDKPRSEVDFTSFLNEHCGTYRAPGGGLNDQVSQAGVDIVWDGDSFFDRLAEWHPSMHWHRNFPARPEFICMRRHRPLDGALGMAPNTTSE
jgi:hypothetical protein